MRHSDFDTQSALGELIDNSIQAGAQHIRIRVMQQDLRQGDRGRPKWRVASLAIGDDGAGMPKETLLHCLQLGYSGRYDDRTGIGRFGVGMTLGGISQCRRIEVFSKQKGGEWRYTYLDLDEIKQFAEKGAIARLPETEAKPPPQEHADLLATDHGTLIIWKKVDRVHRLDRKEIAHWLGRTYRKWLADQVLTDNKGQPPTLVKNEKQVDIELLDGDEKVPIHVYDPLYVIPVKKGDSPAVLVETIEIPVEMDEDVSDAPKYSPTATVKIRLSLLPSQLRPRRFFASEKEAQERFIDEDHCGVSILRQGREVYYGSYISFFKYFAGPEGVSASDWARLGDRYWGAEIEFPATLDNRFKVRNIKVGAKPIPEFAEVLKSKMAPTIVTFRREILAQWDAYDARQRENSAERDKHKPAEKLGSEVPSTPPCTDDLKDAERRKELEELLKPELEGRKGLAEWLKDCGPFAVVPDERMHPSGPFLEVRGAGEITIIAYAARHPFFKLTDSALHDVSEVSQKGQSPEAQKLTAAAKSLRAAIDLFIMGYAEAYNQLLMMTHVALSHPQLLEMQINKWSLHLKQTTDRYIAQMQDDSTA